MSKQRTLPTFRIKYPEKLPTLKAGGSMGGPMGTQIVIDFFDDLIPTEDFEVVNTSKGPEDTKKNYVLRKVLFRLVLSKQTAANLHALLEQISNAVAKKKDDPQGDMYVGSTQTYTNTVLCY